MKSIDYIYDGLKIVQDDLHLKYGTDALLLSAFARGTSKARAVDLGCGNGVIALALAYLNKAQSVVGVELQESSAVLARESVAVNGYESKVEILNADFTAMSGEYCGSFDYAVANPPYMKATSGKACREQERGIARHEIAGDISDFVPEEILSEVLQRFN